jgi:hypothetical protein
MDDNECEEIIAYTLNGESQFLDAKTPPDQPVLLISPCEHRGNHNYGQYPGKLEKKTIIHHFDKENSPTPEFATYIPPDWPVWGRWMEIHQIWINDDHEPWWKGDPEIYATYQCGSVQSKRHMDGVNDEDQWYSVYEYIFQWYSDYGNFFAFAIYEEDTGSNSSASVTFFGKTFALKIQDNDDELGTIPIHINDYLFSDWRYYDCDDAELRMVYQRDEVE